MWIRTSDWTIYKCMVLIMTILWPITHPICSVWSTTWQEITLLTRLAQLNSLIYWVEIGFFFLMSYCGIWLSQLKYPESCLQFEYDPTFPIRGLYYDQLKGCLLKLDFFGSIEPDGCYFGRQKVISYNPNYDKDGNFCCLKELDFIADISLYSYFLWVLAKKLHFNNILLSLFM